MCSLMAKREILYQNKIPSRWATMRLAESWKIKLTENGKELDGSLGNFSFRVGQDVWH